MSDLTSAQKDKLMADLQVVMADAEALLSATAGDASAGVAELRNRVQGSLARAKTGLLETQAVVIDKAKAAAKATDGYVHTRTRGSLWASLRVWACCSAC